jgi:hypothetical protein
MTHSTQRQAHAATDTSPRVRLHAVVGYDGTPLDSRALDATVRLLRGREGNIEVIYVARVPGLDIYNVTTDRDVLQGAGRARVMR